MKRSTLLSSLLFLLAFIGCVENDGGDMPDYGSKEPSFMQMSLEEAQAEVELLVEQIDGKTRADGSVRKIADSYCLRKNSVTRSDGGAGHADLVTYVFNFENEEGYAIVAGDKRI